MTGKAATSHRLIIDFAEGQAAPRRTTAQALEEEVQLQPPTSNLTLFGSQQINRDASALSAANVNNPIHTWTLRPAPTSFRRAPPHQLTLHSPVQQHRAASIELPFAKGEASAKVNTIDSFAFYDRYDRYDTPSPPPTTQQRQQRPLHRAGASISSEQGSTSDRSTPVSSQRALRRTPRFIGTPSPQPSKSSRRHIHLEAVSVGISPPGIFATADFSPVFERRTRRDRPAPPTRQLSQDLLSEPVEDDSTSLPPSLVPPRVSSRRAKDSSAHPFVHISKHTHSAILWAVEEALRYPNPFTPDLIEENATMSDLRGAGGLPAATNGFDSPPARPTAPPSTGSPGIKGPKKIMEERNAREARRNKLKKEEAERERLELQLMQADQERREREELQRRQSERRAPTAGAAPTSSFNPRVDPAAPISTQPIEPAAGSQRRRQQQAAVPPPTQPTSRTQTAAQTPQRTSRMTGAQPPPEPQTPLLPSGVPNVAGAGGPLPSTMLPGESGAAAQPRAQFPHAFERWEALSAHWEGLTSFWIRKLQQHADEIDRDPLSAQLSRQVTDLSAAGANLFHAVVELQRLRASSERKFQRWFFETRAELERHEENKAMLERALSEERTSKAAAIKEAVEKEQNSSRTQKRMHEMQKELQISKEEARRAWEELGRREQEERDRTISLQQGLPTIVGGVQVVPMTQGVPSRGNTSSQESRPQQPDVMSPQYPQQSQSSQRPAGASPGPSSVGGYYQQRQGAGEEERPYSAEGQSEGAYSGVEYVIDAQGNFERDPHGRRIPYPGTPGDDGSDSGADDYETPAAQPPVSYPPSASQYSSQPDYSGSDYAAPGWEPMPRHHHPTRLSDVLEEEETRSRTSAGQSQISRR